MSDRDIKEALASNLAENLRYLRDRRRLTQVRLAQISGVPRSTLANIETGAGNPTLTNLASLASALQITIEELLSAPPSSGRVYPKGTLPSHQRGSPTKSMIHKLLPDPIPGMEIDRMEMEPGSRIRGVPHRPGTREYLYCEKGAISLWSAGEHFSLEAGDVCVFQGDQPHTYVNEGKSVAITLGVVTLAQV